MANTSLRRCAEAQAAEAADRQDYVFFLPARHQDMLDLAPADCVNQMILAGLESAIFGSEDQRLIH